MSKFQRIASVATIGLFAFAISVASAEAGGRGGGRRWRRRLPCRRRRQLSCEWWRGGRREEQWIPIRACRRQLFPQRADGPFGADRADILKLPLGTRICHIARV